MRASRSRARRPGPAWALVLLALAAACGGSAGEERPRNALLISIDTLRPDHLGCYGYARETSPTLDALARRGVRFADVTAAAPWTMPSHASMLTGLYPSHHGTIGHKTRLPASVVTLAEEFKARGFRTLAVVNTLNMGTPRFQFDQGFDEFFYIPETNAKGRCVNRAPLVLAKAREYLEASDDGRPFFLFLHLYDAHTDYTPKAEYRERLVDPYDGDLSCRTRDLDKLRNKGQSLGDDDLRYLRQMYDAEIRQLDDLLGEFLGWLDQRGQLAPTLVAVTSDHGEEFQEHGGLLHGRTQYQELLRIPFLLAGPGIPAGMVVETPVHGVDVTPTLLGALGIPSSMARDGLDLGPLLRGGSLPERALFAEADHINVVGGIEYLDMHQMIRRGADKLILDDANDVAWLYDLAQDPGEQTDLARAHPSRAQDLRQELVRFRAGAIAHEEVQGSDDQELEKLKELGYGGTDDDE